MTTPTHRLIPLTDDRGKVLLDIEDTSEPLPGSIILTEGQYGTAWQRHFSDGLWHSTLPHNARQAKTWSELLDSRRNIVLVYDAEERV